MAVERRYFKLAKKLVDGKSDKAEESLGSNKVSIDRTDGKLTLEFYHENELTAVYVNSDNVGTISYVKPEGKGVYQWRITTIRNAVKQLGYSIDKKVLVDKMSDGGVIKSRDNSTGETHAVVIGSIRKDDSEFKNGVSLNVRTGYSSRITEYQISFEIEDGKPMLRHIVEISSIINGGNERPSGSGKNYNASSVKETTQQLASNFSNGFAKKVVKAVTDFADENSELKKGIKIESEHRDLYLELKNRLEKEGVEMPMSEEEFYEKIAKKHVSEREDYYTLLMKYVEKNHGAGGSAYGAGGTTRRQMRKSSSKNDEKWIQQATNEMEKEGTIGSFTKQAESQGMSAVDFAKEVLNNPNKHTTRTIRRAQFMKNTNPELFSEGGFLGDTGGAGVAEVVVSKPIVLKRGGAIDADDVKSKMYNWFEAYTGNYISEKELYESIKTKLGDDYSFKFQDSDTDFSTWETVKSDLKSKENKSSLIAKMKKSLEDKSLIIFDSKTGKELKSEYSEGGDVKEKTFENLEIVWDSGNNSYGVVLNNYDNKDSEVRLDSDGNQPKDNLFKLGSKGDKGTKKKLEEALKSHKRLVDNYDYEKVNYKDGGDIKGFYTSKNIEDIKSYEDDTADLDFIQPKDVIKAAEQVEVYAFDLRDGSDFMISERSNEEIQKMIDSDSFAFFVESSLDDIGTVQYAKGGKTSKKPYRISKKENEYFDFENEQEAIDAFDDASEHEEGLVMYGLNNDGEYQEIDYTLMAGEFKKGGAINRMDFFRDNKGSDSKRMAKPKGFRFRGTRAKDYDKPTKEQIEKGLKTGKVYFEDRAERSDMRNTGKLMLESGGQIMKNGGSISKGDSFYDSEGNEFTIVSKSKEGWIGKDKKGEKVNMGDLDNYVRMTRSIIEEEEFELAKGGATHYSISNRIRKKFKEIGLFAFKRTNTGLVVAEDTDTHLYGLYTIDGEEIAPAKYQFIDEEVNANGMVRVTHNDGNSGAIEAFMDEYKEGGSVKNNKKAENFWNSGSREQKQNFLTEHEKYINKKHSLDNENTTLNLEAYSTSIYSDLPEAVKFYVKKRVQGADKPSFIEIKNQYEDKTVKQVWEAWTEEQRGHFIIDHAAKIKEDSSIKKEDLKKLYTYTYEDYNDLPESIKGHLSHHVMEGQYKEGGSIKKYSVTGGGIADEYIVMAIDKNDAIKKAQASLRPVYGLQPKNKFKVELIDDSKETKIEKSYVVVSKTKDDYWVVMSKPITDKKKADDFMKITTAPKGERLEVVEAEEVKKHKKVLGLKYLREGGLIEGYDLEEVLNNFIAAGLWASSDDNDESLDSNYYNEDVADESKEAIKKGIEKFIKQNKAILEKHQITDESLGHDLFLDSQGHGVGFWDRGYGEDGETLSENAKKIFASDAPYVGDDNKVYFSTVKFSAGGKVKRADFFRENKGSDSKRMAKPAGYRFRGVRGRDYEKPTKEQIEKGIKSGRVYKEDRPERSDMNNKAKVMLNGGGKIGDEISIEDLTTELGHYPEYPYQSYKGCVLTKCMWRPYYKIVHIKKS